MSNNKLKQLKVECEKIRSLSNKGLLKPEDIVHYAKNKEEYPVLHSKFDWDDSSAAYKHRIQQAREIIRTINITIEYVKSNNKVVKLKVREYVSLSNDRIAGYGYRRLDNVLSNEELTIDFILTIEKELTIISKKVTTYNLVSSKYIHEAITALKEERKQIQKEIKKKKVQGE